MLWFVLFFGLMSLVAGICAISFRNIVHCALFAVAFFFGIACLFFTLRAEFLGAVQIIVYIGAIAILILFAIMLTRDVTGEVASGMIHAGAITGGVVAVAVSVSIILSLFRESMLRGGQSLVERTAETPVVTIKTLGEALMTPYVVPFEVVSILLTAALVGAIVLALEPKKSRGGKS